MIGMRGERYRTCDQGKLRNTGCLVEQAPRRVRLRKVGNVTEESEWCWSSNVHKQSAGQKYKVGRRTYGMPEHGK